MTPTATSQPLVSVVTSTWNAADYLREAIESALAQTYRPLEVIIVDDGSIDHTPEVCASFGDRIRYIRQPKDDKMGATAHHRAFREARGEYLAGLDHDDRWLPEKIARQVAAMQAEPEAGVVFTRFRIIDSAGRDKGPSKAVGPTGQVFHTLLRDNPYCYSSALYPRALLDKVGYHNADTGIGDWDIWLRIARQYPVVMLEEELTEYRVHEKNYSNNDRRMAAARRRVLELYRHQLHPGCAECRRSFRAGMDIAAWGYLKHFDAMARDGELKAALPSLWDALNTSPGLTLRRRNLRRIAVGLRAALTGQGRAEPPAALGSAPPSAK